mgnify:CR=1 FL=1
MIQIADPFSPETKTAKLYVRNEGEGEGKKKDGKTDYNLVFLLNMTALGNLRVDAKTNREDVVVDIKVGKKPIVDFIASQTPQLESRLKEMGFQAVVTTSVQDVVEMEVDDPLNQLLIDVLLGTYFFLTKQMLYFHSED